MKHLDKAGDAFDVLNKEMDAKITENVDQDKINIDDIENKIMDKLESMIEAKLNSSPASNDDGVNGTPQDNNDDGVNGTPQDNNEKKGENKDEN